MDVKRGPIVFRCDAAVESGFEPFYQCLSLAASMQRRRRGTHFFSYLDPLSLAGVIHRANNEWSAAESRIGGPGDLEATLRLVRKLNASAVVVNGCTATTEYLDAIKATGTRVLSIDSEAGIHLPSKIVVNPYLSPNARPYRFDPGAQLLLGAKFALVRAMFRRQRTIRATEQPGPFRAMVCFGDDDHAEQSLLRTKQLLDMPLVDKVSLVTRTHHSMYDEMQEFAKASRGRVEIVTEVKELMTRLVRAHLALTSGDTWAMELCCVGIPQLMMPSRTGHLMNAKRLDDSGVGTLIGAAEDVSFDSLHDAVNLVLSDPIERMGMNRCGRRLIDGRGGDRIVNGLEIVLHSPQALMQGERLAA